MENEYEGVPADDHDALPRRRARHRPRSSNRTFWIVLGSGGCLLFLCCSGLIAWVAYFGLQAFTKDIPEAQAAANRFLDLVQQGKTDDAYALTSTRQKTRRDATQFATFLNQYEMFTKHTSRTQNGFHLTNFNGEKLASIQITLHGPNNATTCTVVVREEGGEWKVDDITVP